MLCCSPAVFNVEHKSEVVVAHFVCVYVAEHMRYISHVACRPRNSTSVDDHSTSRFADPAYHSRNRNGRHEATARSDPASDSSTSTSESVKKAKSSFNQDP